MAAMLVTYTGQQFPNDDLLSFSFTQSTEEDCKKFLHLLNVTEHCADLKLACEIAQRDYNDAIGMAIVNLYEPFTCNVVFLFKLKII